MESLDIGTFVDTFLDGEKEGASRLIRHEMESMIDPLVESLFKQLKHKFVDYLETSWSSQLEYQLAHDREGNEQMIRDRETIFNYQDHDQQYHSQSLKNSRNNIEPALNSIAHFITDPLNVQFEPQLNDHSINSSSSAQESTLIPSTSTDQTLTNTEIQQQSQQLVHIKHNQFDDEDECDCDECVNGEIEVKEEDDDDDDDDSVQWIEDYQVNGPPPVKRPKMDTTPNEINAQTEANYRQSPRQPPDEAQQNQVNNQDKPFITLSLRCPELECPDTFAENELNDHLMDKHSIGPNRCVVKDCKQSFNNCNNLGQHIKQSHQPTTQWRCDKCPKYFTAYKQLSHHNFKYHQLGHFQCSFPSCTFTGECRAKVYSHYTQQHRQTLNCQHPDCSFQTPIQALLKAHQRTHSGKRPYRCKWPNCDYAAKQKFHTIDHIRRNHLAPNSGSVPNGAQLDPKDYLEVVDNLL